MEKRQAQDYIKDVLNQPFDQERFELFIRNLLNDIEPRDNSYSGNLIPEAFRDHIAHYRRIGKYTDPEGEQLDILIIQTRSVKKLERTRTALRNFVVRHLKTFEKQYALAAFYSKEDDGAEWRFSLVKIDYETRKSDKGKIKVEEELVPAKRFSFLVGKYENAHTAQKQLLPLLTNDHSNPLIVKEKDGDGSVEGAFSIQKVTDEFYEQYKELYLKLAENQSLADALKKEDPDVERFVKKLLGQIVFLYFIQKKGWLGVPKEKKMGEGSKRFLQDRFDLAEQNGENYYNSFLRYLFYEALAREHNDEGIKYFYKRLNCKIPFLNGGLFEADFDWKHTDFTIPNNLFRNNEKNKAGDKGTGILDVFDRYNFTIKEDEPLEKEVAVDPEMLGKVFENMLEIKERKSKGAFYTPREIVHYMCQESLIHYLDNAVNDYTESYQPIGSNQPSLVGGSADKKGNLNLEIENKGDIRVPKEDIEILIHKGHLVLENETIALDAKKRIEDGEIKSTKHKSILPDAIAKNAIELDDALKSIKICDPAIGSGAFPVGLLHEIVTARQVLNSFLQRDGYTPYNLKRHAIQESIYGVDIDASAIDIARLRLWLSMIVDEEDYDTIEALPNLDYKIVCGNSLIGLPDNAMRDLDVEKELEDLKERFFSETEENEKKKLRSEIDSKIRELLDSAEEFAGYEIDFDFKLFFSEVWHKKDGFDVVIGNPPYVSGRKGGINEKNKSLFKKNYETAEYQLDLYILFTEKGHKLLNGNGNLIYIMPNTWLSNHRLKKIRYYILRNTSIHEIVLLNSDVFEGATVDTVILSLSAKHVSENKIKISKVENRKRVFKYFENQEDIINNEKYIFEVNIDPKNKFILKNISKGAVKVSDICDVNRGVHAYRKDGYGKSKYGEGYQTERDYEEKSYHADSKFDRSYYPEIRGKNVYPYKYNTTGKFISYGDWLAEAREWKYFTGERIYLRKIVGKTLYCCLVTQENVADQSVYIAKVKDKRFITKYVLAILNSTLITWFFRVKNNEFDALFPQIKVSEFKSLPIKNIDIEKQSIFANVVDYVNYLNKNYSKSSELSLSYFLELINGLIFETYFSEKIKAANKRILTHLGDLKPIYDDMGDEEKLAIIQSEFERLYDPNHPVRNNLETLDSIEEVRVIKEALK